MLVALTCLTRLPSFTTPLWNPDEGFLATQARMLAAGGELYTTVVDRKPPLLPWLYQGAFAVFGDTSLRPLKAAAVLATVTTAALLASVARRRWGERAAWTAGVLSVLLSVGLNPEDTQAATFEVFMLPWTAAAVRYADRRHWASAGIAVAGAALTKQTGGAVLLPVLFLFARDRAGTAALLRLLVACAAPIVAVALHCGPARFLFWTVTGSASYASVDGAELRALLRAAGGTALLCVAAAPVLAVLLHALRTRGCVATAATADLWVWLGASAAAVTVGFQFFGHYFLQLLPPLTLLATAALRGLRFRAAGVAVALTAVLAAGFVTWGFVAERPELAHARKVSAELKHRTAPGDPVLVWGMHPEDYWLADRRPATRYLTAGFLTNYSGGRGGVRTGRDHAVPGSWPRFRHDLAEHLPTVVVDDSRGKPYRPSRFPALRHYLAAHYDVAAVVDGAVVHVRSREGASQGSPAPSGP
ncbi:ArnT family glycosyltransferase [Streptomyces sp. TR06-5]|uniref:ArnT family glycosyltransferase n=1 Tax=Streptomyces sp. TR06-5 TaxID=3385976 RepID=UPI0039A10EAE